METHQMVVIRVISDGHKDELAFVVLAPGTLHEEQSFFATWHTRDKNFRRDILEEKLLSIYPLLNNQFWFAFDYESVAKTLQYLYGIVNQSPPQHTGYLEVSQLFGSTFGQSSTSLTYAAQFLHILPWSNQNTNNARTECDITWEVLNRIALSLVVRQWVIPNQSLSSNDQTNADPETANRDETLIHQHPQMGHTTNVSGHSHHHHMHTHDHTHTHPHEEATYGATDANTPSNNEMARRHHEFNPSTNVDAQHPITEESHTGGFEELGHQQHDNKLNDTNVQSEEEMNPTLLKDAESDNKTSEAFVNNNTGTQSFSGHVGYANDASYQSYDVTQTGDVHAHHYLSSDNKKDRNDENHEPERYAEFASENVESNQAGTRGATGEVKPTQWDDHPGTEMAFLGVPYPSKTGKQSKFFLRDVKEVRDRHWTRPEDMKSNQNKNKTNQGPRGERNGQGGSRNEKKISSNGATNVNDNNNVEDTNINTDQVRPKRKQRPRDKKSSDAGNTSEPIQSTQ